METWSKLYDEEHVAEQAYDLPFLDFSGSGLVLDIGCGRGKQIEYITSKTGGICVGLDIIPFKFPNFVAADACHLPFRDSVFGTTYSLGVIEHLKETERAVGESVRVLQLGGQVLHSVPNMFSLHTFIERPLSNLLFKKWSVGFEKSFTPKEVKQMFHDCGLGEVKQVITVKPRRKSNTYKLSRAESLIYQVFNELDRLFSKIIPNWGFFLFSYAVKKSGKNINNE